MENNPGRQASQLLQCLTQDKKPLGLLLGAGCPFSVKDPKDNPLIPDIKGLTGIVKNMVCCEECEKPWANICSQLEEDGNPEPNIEDILSRVRGLRDYAGAGDVRGLDKNMLEKLEKRICDEIVKCVSKGLPNKSTPYHHVTAWIGAIDRSEPWKYLLQITTF